MNRFQIISYGCPQMAATASLPKRFLYYWAQIYGSQLTRGDNYRELYPTISICFVDGRVFPAPLTHHRRFRLVDLTGPLLLTEDLDIHLLELVNFDRQPADLSSPLDFWLYFLKNGVTLDADALPTPLDRRELRQAMEVLKMFSQDEMARELYEGRLKAERDAKMREMDLQQAEARMATAETRMATAERQRIEAEQEIQHELAKRIQLCERLLARSITDTTELLHRNTSALRAMANALEQEILGVRE